MNCTLKVFKKFGSALMVGMLFSAAVMAAEWIPIVAHTPGNGGAQWRSEVRILNVTDGIATVTLRLHAASGTKDVTQTLQPGGRLISGDGVSLFTASDAVGALEINSDRGVLTASRIYDTRYPSEFGQVLESVDPEGGFAAGDMAYIQQLREGNGARSNIAALNTGDESASATITLFDPLGVRVGDIVLNVPPGQVVESNRPYASVFGLTNVWGGFAQVKIQTGKHVHVFASVVEGAAGDADTLWARKAPADASPGMPLLDPAMVPKYAQPLLVPPVMAPTGTSGNITEYQIAARQFHEQVLPPGMPATTVWGYGRFGDPLPDTGQPSSFNFPALTIEARVNQPIRVKWINGLMDDQGHFLHHLLPLDQTIHWANPPGPPDAMGNSRDPYLGPVPLATHVHGAHVESVSDGHPESWFLPDAKDIPPGYSRTGTRYGTVQASETGSAVFEYANDQRATTLWYHDHALGMTRANVYAGLAGFFLLRDNAEDALGLPGPAPKLGDPPGMHYFELPVVIQDRMFQADGSLYYPDSRAFFDGYTGPTAPDSPVPPVWNPEFFGNTMVVNGRAWPYLDVEPRLYRLRLLNGCNSRTLILALNRDGMVFHRIGNEGGLLPGAPVAQDRMLLAPAERADVILDFSGFQVGDEIVLLNYGPDEPFQGFHKDPPQAPADPATTGQVLKFRIVAPSGQGTPGAIPAALPGVQPLHTALAPRDVTLNEIADNVGGDLGEIPVKALLGTADAGPLSWDAPTTEKPKVGDTEIWRIINLTEDAHPIHLHLVQFQVLDRTPFDAEAYKEAQQKFLSGEGAKPALENFFTGPPESPRPEEAGFKETVIADPGYVTRFIANFDKVGTYVWHCHIIEHEDNEMMRTLEVVAR
jgi:spore coat protein A, manganese oxidase